METRLLCGIALLSAACLVAGCGQSDNVDVYPVRGVVNFDGQPMVGGGSISFIPTGDQPGKAPGGIIGEDGAYELTTYRPGDGGTPGDYRVIVTQTIYDEPEATPDGEAPAEEGGAVVAEEDRIPAVYSNPTNSPLEATIEATSENTINFDLERQ